ncbi:MAG: DNA-directed RNA polymerase subunit omega [Candidatus Omnitrophica bacterium]|nr:DNA-directed RNA polymerase subunit omega [Candidatus Omnitrophota bacterium]
MSYVPLEKMIENCPSLFKLVLGAAERANEINSGAEPLVKSSSKKVTTIAMEEIVAGKVKVTPGTGKKSKAKKEE